jgi:guanyl-specific ribonuclease Sa
MKKLILVVSALLLLLIGGFYFWDLRNEVSEIKAAVTEQAEKKDTRETAEDSKEDIKETVPKNSTAEKKSIQNSQNIDSLTEEKRVTDYLKENGELPDYYITKKEAQREGWVAKEGNLCDVLPGRAIGGDIFTNREKTLPVKKGRIWYEADINYDCGRRNAQRIVYSNDGLIFVTHDHYKNFEEIKQLNKSAGI